MLNKDVAVSLLQTWMWFANWDYYRICTVNGNRILFCEGLEKEGLYYARDLDKETTIRPVESEVLDWDSILARLQKLAAQVEEEMVLVVHKSSPATLGSVEP